MINIFLSVICAVTANLDTLGVSVAYGIKKIKINMFCNIVIAVVSTVGTFISMLFGIFISKTIAVQFINYIGSAILILIGLYFIYEFFKKNHSEYEEIIETPTKADTNNSGTLELSEIFTLALALTVNNLGVGISASIAGLNIWATTILTFIVTMLFIKIGTFIGNSKIFNFIGKYSSLISGIIIALIGVCTIFI
ncbi:MAG: manganese efflux pump [Oscillospiraceae bacterium]|nr:manganese efflux pump [Oscillospiraceae bacterium]